MLNLCFMKLTLYLAFKRIIHIRNLRSDIHKHACHDDVIKWKHFPHNWPFVRGIHRPPVNSPHKGQWRGALMFSLICVWINDWVNNREAGDLRCYRAHYDVIVMVTFCSQDYFYIYITQPETIFAQNKLSIDIFFLTNTRFTICSLKHIFFIKSIRGWRLISGIIEKAFSSVSTLHWLWTVCLITYI